VDITRGGNENPQSEPERTRCRPGKSGRYTAGLGAPTACLASTLLWRPKASASVKSAWLGFMKAAGLEGVSRRKQSATTVRDDSSRPAPDLVDRDFTASGPHEFWVADITYVPTDEDYLYL